MPKLREGGTGVEEHRGSCGAKYVCVCVYIYIIYIYMKGTGVSMRAEKEPERYDLEGRGRFNGL